jgi:hypothetical protein
MRRYNRLLVAFFVIGDAILGMAAFLCAYLLRFEVLDHLLPVVKGTPPFGQYLRIAPFIGLLVPIAFQVQGLYRLRRGRSRVDDFFGVFVGTILAVVLGLGGTLYYQTYYTTEATKDVGLYEVSQYVWMLFLVLNVAYTYASRELIARRSNGAGARASASSAC